MSILSNYTPNCLVRASVNCKVDDLEKNNGLKDKKFIQNFIDAVKISKVDTFRAVTHNKGIMNGIDSVIIATGNDFRSVEPVFILMPLKMVIIQVIRCLYQK